MFCYNNGREKFEITCNEVEHKDIYTDFTAGKNEDLYMDTDGMWI